jgi:hypothetical protein
MMDLGSSVVDHLTVSQVQLKELFATCPAYMSKELPISIWRTFWLLDDQIWAPSSLIGIEYRGNYGSR